MLSNNLIVLKRIEVELKYCKMILDTGNDKHSRSFCAYHLQQACEKMIKIQIYNDLGSTSEIKEHNLHKLCKKYSSSVNIVPVDILKNSLLITEWEAGSRYDMNYDVDCSVLNYFLNVCEQWYTDLLEKGYRYD